MAAGAALDDTDVCSAVLGVCPGSHDDVGPTAGKDLDSECCMAQLIDGESQASEPSTATSPEGEGGALSAGRVRTASVLAPCAVDVSCWASAC